MSEYRVVRVLLFAALLLVCLVPPWVETFQIIGASQTKRDAGYAPIWSPPNVGSSVQRGVRLDMGRIVLELSALGALLGIASMLRRRDDNRRGADELEKLDCLISRQVVKLWTVATHQDRYDKVEWNRLHDLLSDRGLRSYGGAGESAEESSRRSSA